MTPVSNLTTFGNAASGSVALAAPVAQCHKAVPHPSCNGRRGAVRREYIVGVLQKTDMFESDPMHAAKHTSGSDKNKGAIGSEAKVEQSDALNGQV